MKNSQGKANSQISSEIRAGQLEAKKMLVAMAELFIAHGYKLPEVQDWLPEAFYKATIKDLQKKELKDSYNNLRLFGGISTRQIKKLKSPRTQAEPDVSQHDRISYLIHYWRWTPPYGTKGKPNVLPVKCSVGKDFRDLVIDVLPNHPYTGILREFEAIGAVTIENDFVTLKSTVHNHKSVSPQTFIQCCRAVRTYFQCLAFNVNSSVFKFREWSFWNTNKLENPELLMDELRRRITTREKEDVELIESHESDDKDMDIRVTSVAFFYCDPPPTNED